MISYRKGPIGWAVSKDGAPVGVIKRLPAPSVRNGRVQYMVSVVGFRPGDGGIRRAFKGDHIFPSLESAKAKVASVMGCLT